MSIAMDWKYSRERGFRRDGTVHGWLCAPQITTAAASGGRGHTGIGKGHPGVSVPGCRSTSIHARHADGSIAYDTTTITPAIPSAIVSLRHSPLATYQSMPTPIDGFVISGRIQAAGHRMEATTQAIRMRLMFAALTSEATGDRNSANDAHRAP